MELFGLICQLAGALVVVVPLVICLVKYVIKSVKEKNWKVLMDLTFKLIEEAETKYKTGAERKEWVVAMVLTAAKEINYDISEKELSDLIDTIVELTKQVNVKNDAVEHEYKGEQN